MTKKLSKWFPGDQKPWAPGLYERRYLYNVILDEWDGSRWWALKPDGDRFSSWPAKLQWRGLARPPKLQKRLTKS